MPPERLYGDRARATSFGSQAQAYDRFRSGYPAAVVEHLVAAGPSSAVDVGCGTGKLAVALARRGVRVQGVEPDEQMAAVARGHGVVVDTAPFETWDAGGRQFDLLTCAQAWHWVDPAVGLARAASLLRPGGSAHLLWNVHVVPDDVLAAFAAAYERLAPGLPVLGAAPGRSSGADPFGSGAHLTAGERHTFAWYRSFPGDEWPRMVGTFSDHRALGPARLTALQGALRRVVDARGGVVRVRGETHVWSAARRPDDP